MNGLSDNCELIEINAIYMALLGRPIDDHALMYYTEQSTKIISNDLIKSIKNSYEYKKREILQGDSWDSFNKFIRSSIFPKYELSDQYITKEKDIVILQSSDPVRYTRFLEVAGPYNYQVALSSGMSYSSYIGLKRGSQPYQAIFNRIFMLHELILSGYSGWAVYIDADGVLNKNYPLKTKLKEIEDQNKYLFVHPPHGPESEHFDWCSCNTAVFAIDLSRSLSKILVEAWVHFYNFHPELISDTISWTDTIHDQWSFNVILCAIDEFKSHIAYAPLENLLTVQFPRVNNDSDSSKEDIDIRIHKIKIFLESIS